eukprot:PhF_6_TR20011/c0_g1_i4/m.29223
MESTISIDPSRTITKIDIFDFDGTLFRTPEPSTNIWGRNTGRIINLISQGGYGWYDTLEVMLPPYMPEYCDESWFSPTVLPAIRSSCADEGTLTVLMTGRKADLFTERIGDMLAGVGVKPDVLYLKPATTDRYDSQAVAPTTMEVKINFLDGLIRRFCPQKVRVYEDRTPHKNKFESYLKTSSGVADAVVYLVTDASHNHLPAELEVSLVNGVLAPKYGLPPLNALQCHRCNGYGHMVKDCRVSGSGGKTEGLQCYHCGGYGHMARNCCQQK